VFAAHELYGVSAITALTVQSTQGVRRVEAVSGLLLRETLDCLAEDVDLAGIKIGMLGSAEMVGAVAGFLREAEVPRERVVLDPVLRSSSGRELLEASGAQILREELLPWVGWVTPNIDELAVFDEFRPDECRTGSGGRWAVGWFVSRIECGGDGWTSGSA